MRVLVFDTETTGLPTERNAPIQATDKFPHVVQLSYVVFDTEQQHIVECVNDLIRLKMPIPPESTLIHGITDEQSQRNGIPMPVALAKFMSMLDTVETIVGHNLQFDKRMLQVEAIRHNFPVPFGLRWNEYCTMQKSRDVCQIVMEHKSTQTLYYKLPSLAELHDFCFQTVPPNLHNALVDVLTCLRCYLYLQNKPDLLKTCSMAREMLQTIASS